MMNAQVRQVRSASAIVVSLLMAGALCAPVHAATDAMTTVEKPAKVSTTIVTAQAIVEAIDTQQRQLKLLAADNRRFVVTVDPSVENFDQIQPRDRVNIEYLQSVAIAVTPAGETPTADSTNLIELASAGEKPFKANVNVRRVRGMIVELDRDMRRGSILMPDGTVQTVNASEDARLDLVNVGDSVELVVTTAVAVGITPPTKP